MGAGDGIRTRKSGETPAPKAGAVTNFATPAHRDREWGSPRFYGYGEPPRPDQRPSGYRRDGRNLESWHLPRKSQGNKRRNPQNLVLHRSNDPHDVVNDGDGEDFPVGGESGSTKPAEKPVSLHPLEFEDAVRDLLRVKPRPGRRRPSRD